jgi:acetyl-CoA carboxylase beta subunit
MERGMVDLVAARSELPDILASVLGTLMLGRARARAA